MVPTVSSLRKSWLLPYFAKGDFVDFYTNEKEIETQNYGHVFFVFLLLSKKMLAMLFVCGKKKLKALTLCS